MHLVKNKDKVRVTRIRGDKGETAGYTVEHKDGKTDAVARPQPATYRRKGER